MCKLTNWIRNTYNPKINESKTTNSIYFTLFGHNGLTIRVSDHIFWETPDLKECDISVISPENDKNNYVIMVKGARGILNYGFERAKIFIEDVAFVWKLKHDAYEAREVKKAVVKAEKQEKAEEKKKMVGALLNSMDRVYDEIWPEVVNQYIMRDVEGWKNLGKKQRKECKLIFEDPHKIPYADCVKILNYLLKQNPSPSPAYLRSGVISYVQWKYERDKQLSAELRK